MTPVDFDIAILPFLKIGFYLLLMFYIVFTAVLYYHWREYSVDEKVTRITLIFYFSTTLPLLGIMGILAFIM
ncbi:MAG: hypothetical protein KBC78_03050 [Candidatus Pacebacteria bacterium]|nr:hypothetical protein [Candidatus Paceibacterota bacterium]